MCKPLVVTMGDPTGIGPELIVRAAAAGLLNPNPFPVVVAGDPEVLLHAATSSRIYSRLQARSVIPLGTHTIEVEGHPLHVRQTCELPLDRLVIGRPDHLCGRAMADTIRWACDACLAEQAGGMVTAPINKRALQEGGTPFPGHTEMLASACNVKQVVMMLAGEHLRVCLVTTHCALREVPEQLSVNRILATIQITDQELRRSFGLIEPRLAVLALNPHAGEAGLFGDEEKTLIAPAIRQAYTGGIAATGPYSADSLFWFAAKGDFDAVICMYHDQGLIPLKLLSFQNAVNVTLGLPIVRTSVDHGTAYDLVGTGRANHASLVAAVQLAAKMAAARERTAFGAGS